ncbi:sigma factor-like helix-turn-helix DNA-binding protein [uncultured Sphingomonas sp.]|uniref:sigma factor-like helix-turn-helix DNA-binding protein n=1 Tax=uncultured Sphingomonas sp. TaxID=158754 RepID=UPI00260A490F|nr:sigma factor-like helix-turn-helix DNA-binding protein [uncultured Sphingomonas sp.]
MKKDAQDLGDRLVRLTRALAVLPEGPRTVYLLHARDEVPFDAIAVRLGIARADVMAHLAHALAALSKALDESSP